MDYNRNDEETVLCTKHFAHSLESLNSLLIIASRQDNVNGDWDKVQNCQNC